MDVLYHDYHQLLITKIILISEYTKSSDENFLLAEHPAEGHTSRTGAVADAEARATQGFEHMAATHPGRGGQFPDNLHHLLGERLRKLEKTKGKKGSPT